MSFVFRIRKNAKIAIRMAAVRAFQCVLKNVMRSFFQYLATDSNSDPFSRLSPQTLGIQNGSSVAFISQKMFALKSFENPATACPLDLSCILFVGVVITLVSNLLN